MHPLPMFFPWFIYASFALVPLVNCSSDFMLKPARSNIVIKHQGDSPKALAIVVHGILLWASMGFLMPVGILIIRMSSKHEFHRTRLKVLFYLHAALQVCSVLLATAAAVLSVRNFENSFNNCHQRVGLVLYGAIYVQVLTGFRRPKRGRPRCIWYFFHWIMGTAVSFVGIFNTYTGLKAYHSKTSKSASLWTILFTSQVSFMAFFYLFQEKWDYIQKQGVILGNEPIIPSSVEANTQTENKTDASTTETHRKSNALGTYFSRSNALNKLFQHTGTSLRCRYLHSVDNSDAICPWRCSELKSPLTARNNLFRIVALYVVLIFPIPITLSGLKLTVESVNSTKIT